MSALLEKMNEMREAILAARESDLFPERGQIAVAVKRGRAQVQRLRFKPDGSSVIVGRGNFVPLHLVALHLTAESQIGSVCV